MFLIRTLDIARCLRLHLVVDDEHIRRAKVEEVAIEKLELAANVIRRVARAIVSSRHITADVAEILVHLLGHDLIDAHRRLSADASLVRGLEIAEVVEEERVGQRRFESLQRGAENARTAVDRFAVPIHLRLPVRSTDEQIVAAASHDQMPSRVVLVIVPPLRSHRDGCPRRRARPVAAHEKVGDRPVRAARARRALRVVRREACVVRRKSELGGRTRRVVEEKLDPFGGGKDLHIGDV